MPMLSSTQSPFPGMHGGLSPKLNHLDDIRNIDRPLLHPGPNTELAHDLMWADPKLADCSAETDDTDDDDNKGWCRRLYDWITGSAKDSGYGDNALRRTSVWFSSDQVRAFILLPQLMVQNL